MNDERIPLVDLKRDDVPPEVVDVFRQGDFIGGPWVAMFEKEWMLRTGARACIGVNSGTDALTLLLGAHARAARAQHDGYHRRKVVLPATSFVATLEAALNVGLEPVLCDVDPDGLMSRASLRHLLFTREDPEEILAIVPVHLYGRAVEVDDIAEEFEVPYVIEDACQAHGARYGDGEPVGSRNPAAWSFMPAKILGAVGDAGAITLPHRRPGKDAFAAAFVRAIANHGRIEHNLHGLPGVNSRMDALQAAYLYRRYLETDRMADLLGGRARAAAYYGRQLSGLEHVRLSLPADGPGRSWSYYTIKVDDPDDRGRLREHMHSLGVSTGCHYPYTLADAFRDRSIGYISAQFPIAWDLARRTVTLPLWPDMPTGVQDRVVRAIRSYYRDGP